MRRRWRFEGNKRNRWEEEVEPARMRGRRGTIVVVGSGVVRGGVLEGVVAPVVLVHVVSLLCLLAGVLLPLCGRKSPSCGEFRAEEIKETAV